jgi:hypothetical protein
MTVNPEDLEQLGRDYQEMREGILAVVWNWSGMENDLAWMLGAMLAGDVPLAGDPRSKYGMIVYFTPSGTETRINIVNNIAQKHFTIQRLWRCLPIWNDILKRIQDVKKDRNHIVHGNVSTVTRGDNAPQCRLSLPIFDTVRREKRSGKEDEDGLTAAQVTEAASKIAAIGSDIRTLSEAIARPELIELRHPREEVNADEQRRTFLEKFAALEARLTKDNCPVPGRSGPKPSGRRKARRQE